ncbi:hypothetical protein AF335_12310 [Streptomyces eurocidicus]|nr:hypothetical protein [Streptomyces eurocidicus]MBF6050740.1 hypothetical protein [Streptomyces eurocidicus]PNE33618.1 hypothetical protein AF335_12310 [Streptomyces eurocidicus]
MIALASVVALAVVLPLAAATAGPAGLMSPEKTGKRAHGGGHGGRPAGAMGAPGGEDDGTTEETSADDTADTEDDEAADSASGAGGSAEPREPVGAPGSDVDGGEGGDEGVVGDGPDGASGAPGRTVTHCGPELSSPAGVEAQTCVLERGRDTWARTYFRNATGGPLTAVLTLMGPDARTVQVHCRTGASDDPDGCETPHRPTARGGDRSGGTSGSGYSAVAEFASAEGDLLLRSGSNSPGDRAD